MKKIYKRNWLFELKSLAVMGTLLFAGTASAQLSGTYTIDAGGTGDFMSFTELSDTLIDEGVSGAVTINVVASSGPYNEEFYLDEISGSSSSNTITINGNGEKIREGSPVIELEGTDFITFDNLVIEQTGSPNDRIFHAYDDVEGVTINDCELIASAGNAYSGYPGYYTSAYIWFGNHNFAYQTPSDETSDITITNNKLWKGTSSLNGIGKNHGVVISNPTSFTGDQNIEIKGNDIQDIGQYGIYTRYASGWNIEGNNVHNDNNNSSTQIYGIYVYDYFFNGSEAVTIHNNVVSNLANNRSYTYLRVYGIYAYGYYAGVDFDITNNVIDVESPYYLYGIYAYAYNASGTHNIVNNTIRMGGNTTNTRSRHYGIYNYYAPSGDVKNNIIVDETAVFNSSGGSWLIYTSNPSCTFDNNSLDNSTMGGTGVGSVTHTAYNGGDRTSLADWQGNAGGANSIASNPQFTDVSAGNYMPQSIAMANKGATGATVPALDLDGVTRSVTNPDIGALEYFVDVEVVSVDMVGTATECAPYSEAVVITVKNNGVNALSDIPLQFDINGGNAFKETMAGPLAGGASATFTFDAQPYIYGTNSHLFTASVVGDDDVPSNSSATHTIGTIVSPTGGSLSQGATFDGYFKAGAKSDPDVTVNTYSSTYDIVQPTGLGAPSATSYTYSLTATNNFGIDVTGSGFTYTALAEEFTADPATTLAGDTIFMELTVLDANTGCDTSFGRWIYVPHTPVASFNASNICLGDIAQFKNTSTLAGEDYIVTKWEFDDPDASITDDNSDIKDGFWEYSTYGNGVTVEMTVANGLYPKFEYPTTNTINVTPTPEIDFKVLNACEGTPITIANNTTLPTSDPITYTWDFGGVGTSTLENPSYTFATPGIREVTVIASASGCESTLTKNAYQFEKPIATFTSTGECNFVDVAFMSTSTIPNNANMGYSWDFDGSGISREEGPSFAFATPGNKSVTLTATSEFGCVDAITQNISLNESPVADFDWLEACNLTPIAFNFTGSVPGAGTTSTYAWDFAGEATAARVDPTHLFSKVGTKEVTLTIADLNGCTNTITKEVNVVLQAVADFEAASVCEGAEAVFTNKSEVAAGGLSYKWSFGDGPTSTSEDLSPTHTYGEARTYNVTLEAIVEGGCSDLITKDVVVNPSPIATFASNKDGRTVVPTATQSGNDAYRWTFGDGGSSSDENPTYTYVNVDNGTYKVCLATREGDCWNESCDDITIDLAGIANLTESNDMINVYPNPTTGKFTISVDNASEVVVKVGDILGNVLDIEVRDNLNGEYSVDMSAVADGVYFVQVRNGDFYATKRITVSK
jgi:PKD repeat protein